MDKGGSKRAAELAFSKAAKLHPESWATHAHLGMLYITLQDFAGANKEIAAVEETGAPGWATWLKAILALVQEDFDGALTQATALSSSAQPSLSSAGYAMHATLLADLGRRQEAMAVLKSGIAFDHNNKLIAEESDKQIGLAYLHYRRKAFDKCKELAQQAVELDPSPRHLMEAGTLLARCGDIPSANRQLKALKTAPTVPLVQAAIARLQGEIALASHHPDEAALDFAQAVRTIPAGDDQSYFADALIAFGAFKDGVEILKHIAEDPGHTLMYRDHDFPGLWGDSLEHLALTPDAATACPYAKKYLKLRAYADPDIQSASNVLKGPTYASCPQ